MRETEYEVQRIRKGQFLSNPYLFAILTRTSDVGGVWSPRVREFYCHSFELILYFGYKTLEPRKTTFSPFFQSTSFSEDFIFAEKTVFLPLSPEDYQKAVWIALRIENRGIVPATINIKSRVRYSEGPWRKERIRALDKRTVRSSDESGRTIKILSSSLEFSSCDIGEGCVELEYLCPLNPSAEISCGFLLTFSDKGEERFPDPNDFHDVFIRSSKTMSSMLSNLSIIVPDRLLDLGIQWGKVGALRSRQIFLQGPGISSDPPGDMMNTRDLFWYVMGAYLLDPDFTKEAVLELSRIYQNFVDGPLPEAISASFDPPILNDYNLNINDNTPLFIIACHRIFELSRDMDFLKSVYPAVEKATRYIISQIFGGLVRCLAEGSNVWGIAGWRNFIPEFRRNGAVTEVNVECYRALLCASDMASIMGNDEFSRNTRKYAELLWNNVEEELINKGSDLPLTTVSLSGEADDEVTGDIALVAIFGECDRRRERIGARLCEQDFWTEYGIRTVSESSPYFNPYGANGFLGGVNLSLSCWVLRILARYDPDRALRLARNICRIFSHPNPSTLGNLVPSQFPEWLDGEGFKCIGQTLSPRASSSLLWAILEGFFGFHMVGDEIAVDPSVPHEWEWMALRKVRTWKGDLSLLFWDGKLFSTLPLRSTFPLVLCDEDITDSVSPPGSVLIGLRKGEEMFLLSSGAKEKASLVLDGVPHDIHLVPNEVRVARIGV